MTRFARTPNRVRPSWWLRVRLRVEPLEKRENPSTLAFNDLEPNDTLDAAQSVGILSEANVVAVRGTIGSGTRETTDVDWYSFSLDRAATVALTATGLGAEQPILGLYNSDPYDFGDPFNPVHYRLLEQTPDGGNRLVVVLGAGTYFAAISGDGNRYFHPFLAGSGDTSKPAEYRLTLEAKDLTGNASLGPAVLSIDPGTGTELAASPFAIRIDFNAPLDPGTIGPDQSVRVLFNAAGTFGDGTDAPVALASYNLSTSGRELQLFPAAALKPGYYDILVAGDTRANAAVLAGLDGVPVGTDDGHPTGQDYAFSFRITGVEGQAPAAGADDTAPFAHELGELAPDVLVQRVGAIGDDPYLDPLNPDAPSNPSSDVDLYHFRIVGAGPFAFSAEVLAGRIGSPLDPGLSLFKLDPSTGQLAFVGGNNDTRNATLAADGSLPLNADSALFEGLSEGDYYLAVSANTNAPTTVEGGQPGTNGIFDPNVSHSGTAGFSTGPYVLRLASHADTEAPTVVASTPDVGANLNAPPTSLVVGFSEAMNLRKLVYLAFEKTSQETTTAVYLEGSDGTRYFPRLQSYDDSTNRATFLMLDGVPNGDYQLHLSRALTDLAGNPLVGSDASGDYLVPFTVFGPSRGVNGDPLVQAVRASSDSALPQEIGTIFPHEWLAGVTVTRVADPTATDVSDAFRFQVLQGQLYGFALTGTLPPGTHLDLVDDAGNLVIYGSADEDRALVATLNPGHYVVRVSGWSADRASGLEYELRLSLLGASDNAPSLTVGPTPAVQLRTAEVPLPPPTPPTRIPPPSPSVPDAPARNPGTATTSNVSLPVGLLGPLAAQPLGGSQGPFPAVGNADRVAIQLPASLAPASDAVLARASEFAVATAEGNPVEASLPSAVPPPVSEPIDVGVVVVVVVAAPVASLPLPDVAPAPTEIRHAGNRPLLALVPGMAFGVEARTNPDTGVVEVNGFAVWRWLASFAGAALPYLFWRRSRRLAQLRHLHRVEV